MMGVRAAESPGQDRRTRCSSAALPARRRRPPSSLGRARVTATAAVLGLVCAAGQLQGHAVVSPAETAAAADEGPAAAKHLLLVVADDLGYGDLGITGSAVKTPVLDNLAANGVRLLSFYVQRACSPTRAALQTGRYNIRYRMQSGVLEPGQPFGLSLNEVLLPQALRAAAGCGDFGGGDAGRQSGARNQQLFRAATGPEAASRGSGRGATGAPNCSAAPHDGWNCGRGGIAGHDPVSGPNATADPSVCCSLCASVPECEVWTVYHKACYLKTASCKMARDSSSVTGGAVTPPAPPPPYVDKCPPPPPAVPGTWATHAVGKWHLGFWHWDYTPTFRGFDSYMGYYTGGEDYYSHNAKGVLDFRSDACPRCGEGCSQPRFDLVGNYSTHVFTEQAESVIAAHNESQRLFLYLAYQAVHAPTEVPESYTEPYESLPEPRRTFAGMLSCLDEGVGNVTSALKARGMWQDTLLYFTTDNGAPTPSCGGAQGGQNVWPFGDAPTALRGGKCSCWEGGLRGTAFVYSPLLPPAARGRHATALMHAVDVLPTLLSALHGAAALEGVASALAARGQPLDGVDQWAVIASASPPAEGPRTELLLEADPYCLPRDPLYCGDQHGGRQGTGYYALRRGNLKVILGDPAGGTGDGWYCTGLPCNYTGWVAAPGAPLNATSVQLYDVAADPGERRNLASEQPEAVKSMLAALLAYNASAEPSYQCGPDGPWQQNGTLSPWR